MTDLAVVAGLICVDLFPALDQPVDLQPGNLTEVGALSTRLGGCVANTGGTLAHLGIPVSLQGCVGDDWLGQVATDLARQIPAAEQLIEPRTGATTSYSLVIEPPGTDRAFWHHPGANGCFDPATVDLTNARLVHVGYPPLLAACLEDGGAQLAGLFVRALRAGITTSIDLAVAGSNMATGVNWDKWLAALGPVTSLVSPSRDDLVSMLDSAATLSAKELAWRLIADGFAVAMVTDGPRGLYLATADGARLLGAGKLLAAVASTWANTGMWLPAHPVTRIVTTNGAGDAATAGLLAALWHGLGPNLAAQAAAGVAAQHLTGHPVNLDRALEGAITE